MPWFLPLAAVAIAGWSTFSNMKSATRADRERAQMWSQIMDDIDREQIDYNKASAPLLRQLESNMAGLRKAIADSSDHSSTLRARGASQAQEADTYARLAAPGITENYKAAGQTLDSNLASRGVGGAGFAASERAGLERYRLGAVGEARMAGFQAGGELFDRRQALTLQGAQSLASMNQQNILTRLGLLRQPNSRSDARMRLAGNIPYQQGVDMSSLTYSLLNLGSEFKGFNWNKKGAV